MMFSIITVTYNSERFLQNTITSLDNQTCQDFEYLIVDGLSTDNTLAIIEKNRSIISKYVSEEDSGIYDAMNKGIDLASGNWYLFLNAGDEFYSDTVLEEISKTIEKNPSSKVINGITEILDEAFNPVTKLKPLKFNLKNLNMFGTRTVCHQSIFVSRSIIPKYDLSFRLKAELDWYYRICQKISSSETINTDFVISKYLLGGEGDIHFFENLKERVEVLRKNNSLLAFLFHIPFLLIPLIFRARRKIFGR